MGSAGGPRHQVQVESEQSPLGRSKDRALAPHVTRVDTDPSQTYAWQKESTVRHIQEPSAQYGGGHSNQNTPPNQQWQGQDLENPNCPRNDDNQPDNQRQYRNSGWGRPQNGSVGVTGAG